MNKNTLLPIIVILVGVVVGGVLLFGGTNQKAASDLSGAQDDIRKVDLAIDNLFCIGCRSSVVNSVLALPGVIQADADTRDNSGWVIYDSSKTNKENIVAASVFQAYPARILDDQPYGGQEVGSGSVEIPKEIEDKLNKLAQVLQEKDITIEVFFQKELDDAIEQGFWDKANNLLDNYLEAYN